MLLSFSLVSLALLGSIAGAASAGILANGDFETGDLTGWTSFVTTNGSIDAAGGAPAGVAMFDTTGSGASYAAHFSVGEIAGQVGGGPPEGGGIYQDVTVSPGTYVLSADLATQGAFNADCGTFTLLIDGAAAASHDFGECPAAGVSRSALNATMPLSGGSHELRILITRRYGPSAGLTQWVDNVSLVAPAAKPTATISRPSDGTVYPLDRAVTAAFRCAATELALASCVGTQSSGANPLVGGVTTLDTSTLGTHTITVTATDVAGNATTVVSHYTVVYTWNGFFSPIGNESDSSLNLARAGDLIKLGFGLNGDRGLGVLASVTSVQVACPAWTSHPVAGAVGATPGLAFGVASAHYAYGWQTSAGWAGTCRQFQLRLNDGTPAHTAVFMFSGRTVAAGAFQVQWSPTDPDEITSLSWNGSPNLTNSWVHPFCPEGGDHEFFGNSWDTGNDVDFRALVGWGSVGTWSGQGPNAVSIASSTSSCFGTNGTQVSTSYQFFDDGANVNRFRVQRRFAFGSTPFAFDLRPYIPRLYPRDRYSLVIHPNANGTALVTEVGNDCELGCEVTNWNGTWFAVHDPSSGLGMIVKHEFSAYHVALWVDMDGGSQTTASSVALLAPPGGFTGTVAETESLCFYDAQIWTPSLTLPPGC